MLIWWMDLKDVWGWGPEMKERAPWRGGLCRGNKRGWWQARGSRGHLGLRTEVKHSHRLLSMGDLSYRILHKYQNSQMLKALTWNDVLQLVCRKAEEDARETWSGLWRGRNPQKQNPWKQKPEVEPLYSQFPFRYIYHLRKREPKARRKDQVCHRAEPVSCSFSVCLWLLGQVSKPLRC